jgi:hypothetical protein
MSFNLISLSIVRVVFILPVVNEGERERESGYVFKWIFNVRKEKKRPTSQTLVEVSPPSLSLSSLFLSCFDVGGETCASGVPAGTSLKQMIVVKTEKKGLPVSCLFGCRKKIRAAF